MLSATNAKLRSSKFARAATSVVYKDSESGFVGSKTQSVTYVGMHKKASHESIDAMLGSLAVAALSFRVALLFDIIFIDTSSIAGQNSHFLILF